MRGLLYIREIPLTTSLCGKMVPMTNDDQALVKSSDHYTLEDQPEDNKLIVPEIPEKPCIIVMHASVGSGHRSAANAIAQALEFLRDEQQDLKDLEIEVLDVLDFGRIKFDGSKTASLFNGASRPIYDLTWRYSFTGTHLWGGGYIWHTLMFSAFTDYVSEKKPIAIIATHIVAANVAVAARMQSDQYFPILCVPTDYETEGLWPHRCTDLFCVANESMAETLRPRGVPEKRIQITGIPTREEFRRTYDRSSVRTQFDLPQDRNIVLVLGGSYMPQPYIRFRTEIDKLLPYLHTLENDMHFVFIAGKDPDYTDHLRLKCNQLGLTNVTVFSYVDDIAALMSASDLTICKPGGLTVTECLCAQLPMILLGKAYGQEKINMRMLTSVGAAIHVTTAFELLDTLQEIAKNPEHTHAMLVNGTFLRKPNAARDIASAALRLAKEPKDPNDSIYRKCFVRLYKGEKPAHVR